LKFDCKSTTETLTNSQQHCNFPYAFDSCNQVPEQEQFLRRILKEIGVDKKLARYYNQVGGPDQEVTLGPEHSVTLRRGIEHNNNRRLRHHHGHGQGNIHISRRGGGIHHDRNR
jgi:hypothetical protein